jgi:hypothetical protein
LKSRTAQETCLKTSQRAATFQEVRFRHRKIGRPDTNKNPGHGRGFVQQDAV